MILNTLLIHPGETLFEILQHRKISRKDLAIRTGFDEKYISDVIHGQQSISSEFAIKLEQALEISASFWINLQANYNKEK